MTLHFARQQSVGPNVRFGQKRTFKSSNAMSALPPKADMVQHDCHVRFVPILLQKSVAGLFGQ
jgi:hypothetical protein